MDAAKLHLLINYYPSIGMILGTLLLMLGFVKNMEGVNRLAVKIVFLMAAFTFPVFVTGEIAGGANGTYAGAAPASVGQHKALARPAFLAIEAAGIAALVSLFLLRRNSAKARWSILVLLIVSVVSCVLIVRTTYLGRQIKWANSQNETGSMSGESRIKEINLWHA